MGGLIARAFIINHGQKFPIVKIFISLATPWGGDTMSEYGVEQSPLVIPSSIDMQPKGEFINSLYRIKMPENISFYLFYGFKGDRLSLYTNNDGTIALFSLLDQRSQSETKMNYAFNEDHTSILSSEEVLRQYNTVLNEFDEIQNNSTQNYGGYVKIHFNKSYESEGVSPRHKFILHPVDNKNNEIVTYLSDDDNNRILGPFPTGDYLASMVTIAGKLLKKYVPISIKSNNSVDVDFVLMPEGVIRGCVVTALEPEDHFPGMPDITYRSVDRKVKIQSITLEGKEIHRELEPVTGKEINNNDYLILRDDFCYNGSFGLFGLPTGDYKIIIKAEGSKTMVKTYSVVSGIPKDFRIIEMMPN